MVPAIKHTPLHTCTPRKSVSPSFFLSNAPAIGAPISVAMLDTLHDMPSLVPKRDRSGVMFANAADGTVTSAAEKKPICTVSPLSLPKPISRRKEIQNLPHSTENAINVPSLSILIHANARTALTNVHSIQATIAPK